MATKDHTPCTRCGNAKFAAIIDVVRGNGILCTICGLIQNQSHNREDHS
jgi:ribosomal protein L37E